VDTLQKIREQDADLVQITDAALADATRRAGPHLACRPGCTPCCHGAFAIHALDALRLRAAMGEMAAAEPARAGAIAARAKQYWEEFAPTFPGNRESGVLNSTEEAREAFEDFANEAACPALDPHSGLCDLYAARPMTCRVFGPPVRARSSGASGEGLAVCELCFTQATPEEIAAAEMHVPHEEEEALLAEMESCETIVAFCLLP